MRKIEILYRHLVENDVRNGLTCEELVRKYPISMYYARKWSGEIYHKTDMDHLVRDRYKWLVINCSAEIINDISESMGQLSSEISTHTWDEWDEKIRRTLYDLAKEIVKKN